MKEKVKGHPRRRFLWLFAGFFFLLSGYFSLPFAQTAFIAWWEDDPFTPLCNLPHLELAYTLNNLLTIVQANSERSQRQFEIENYGRNIAWLNIHPAWLALRYNPVQGMPWTVLDTSTGQYLEISGDNLIPSPDQRYLIASSGGNGAHNHLAVLDLATMQTLYVDAFQETNFIVEENLLGIQWSPDSRYFVYTRIQSDENFEGISSTVLVNQNFERIDLSDRPLWYTAWSPDSRWLLYSQDGAALYGISPDEPEKPYLLTTDTIYHWSVSPDGSSVAYLLENEIIIREIPTGRELWRFAGSRLGDWSENGLLFARKIASQDAVELLIADTEQQSLSPAFAQMPFNVSRLQWSPSGHAILYQPSDDSRSYLLPYPFQTAQEPFLIQPSSFRDAYSNLNWLGDGQHLAYHGENHWFYLLNTETFQTCRMMEAQDASNYDWRIIPQS